MALEWLTALNFFIKYIPDKWKEKFQEWVLKKGETELKQRIADGKADEVFREFLLDQNAENDIDIYVSRLDSIEPKTENIRRIHSRITKSKKKSTKKAGGKLRARKKAKISRKVKKKSHKRSIRKTKKHSRRR